MLFQCHCIPKVEKHRLPYLWSITKQLKAQFVIINDVILCGVYLLLDII